MAQVDTGLEVPSVVEPPPPGPRINTFDANLVLHHSRGAMLRDMPPGAQRLLSAGCSGNWYFDWIEQCYGPVAEHVGIEFYMPRPDTLPANVTWIINTASNMEAVADASCDLVFSGQNLEHLWADEVSGFLVEAARVTKNGGHLVVDSPNRDVTRPLNWSHPEHTIELTVPEIRQLLQLAGFEVTKEVGLWLCRDPKTGRILPFDPNTPEHDWSQVERLVAAPAHPEHSFLWWLEGRRNDDAPDKPAIDALLSDIHSHAWPERTQRVIVPVNWKVEPRADGDWIIVPHDEGGVVFFGPYMPLRAGHYIITFDIMPEAGSHGTIGFCDVCYGPDGTALQRQEITADTQIITFVVDVASLLFGGQFRCFSTAGGFAIRRGAALSSILA